MPRKIKPKRDLTVTESNEIILKYLDGESEIIQFSNHRKYSKLNNTFRFTVNAISFKFLTRLMRDKNVSNIFFNPAMPPPGTGIDGASLRFKVYIEYHQKQEN